MTSLLPWPDAYLATRSWSGVRRLLARCHDLAARSSLPATLMLLGEAGLGREGVAVELAAMLVCRDDGGPGCACGSCDRVRRGVHPDVEIVDIDVDENTGRRKTEISIAQIRSLVDRLPQRPFEGRRRVVIVVSAHTPPLNAFAASAALKALEEPPEHVTWVLLAGNPARVLPTIVSRSVLVRVPSPTREELVGLVARFHALTPELAEGHLRLCFDDGALALQMSADESESGLAALHERTSRVLSGDPLAALQLATRAKAVPATIPTLAEALLAKGTGGDPAVAEAAVDGAADLLAADLRRALLHLDAESVTAGALVSLVRAIRAVPGPG